MRLGRSQTDILYIYTGEIYDIMNLQQLQYIIAVDNYRNFARAAEKCFVTQPTLSMMIKKLESEHDIIIFDRTRQPVVPTEIGKQIIQQARVILNETKVLDEILSEYKNTITGDLSVGIIPTLSPYLVPLFINSFTSKYKNVNLTIAEQTTEVLIDMLHKSSIDVAILVTPLNDPSITEIPMFYEEFFIYQSANSNKQILNPEDIDPNELWLLEEGHCLRSQIMNLCDLKKANNMNFIFKTGSLETLKQLVDSYRGITIMPELATLNFSEKEQKRLIRFRPPAPVREVSLALHRNYVKKRLIDALKSVVIENIPKELVERNDFRKIEING